MKKNHLSFEMFVTHFIGFAAIVCLARKFAVFNTAQFFYFVLIFKLLTFETSVKLQNFYFKQHTLQKFCPTFYRVECIKLTATKYYDNRYFISLYKNVEITTMDIV